MSLLTRRRRRPEALSCRELVSLVTDYLEGTIAPADRARFERHIGDCPHCTAYLDGLHVTLRALGRITERDLHPAVREELMQRFRLWQGSPG